MTWLSRRWMKAYLHSESKEGNTVTLKTVVGETPNFGDINSIVKGGTLKVKDRVSKSPILP